MLDFTTTPVWRMYSSFEQSLTETCQHVDCCEGVRRIIVPECERRCERLGLSEAEAFEGARGEGHLGTKSVDGESREVEKVGGGGGEGEGEGFWERWDAEGEEGRERSPADDAIHGDEEKNEWEFSDKHAVN